MIDIAVLRAMAANGATVDMILAVLEAAQECEQKQLAEKRAAVRDRKRKSRNGHACHAPSRDVTNVTVTDVTDKTHIEDTYLLSSLPKERKIKKERKVSISMPIDWTPSAKGVQFATDRGWTQEHTSSEATRFRDHGLSTGKRYLDIDAAWRNWVTSPYQLTPYQLKRGPAQAIPNGKLTVHQAAANLTARVRALDEPAPSDLCDRAGGGVVRRISPG